jgi:hypothetical protein
MIRHNRRATPDSLAADAAGAPDATLVRTGPRCVHVSVWVGGWACRSWWGGTRGRSVVEVLALDFACTTSGRWHVCGSGLGC